MKKITLLLLAIISTNSHSFDLEDYATTYRATQDAYIKAYNEKRLAEVTYFKVLKEYQGLIPMPTAGIAKSGLELNTCAHLADCKAARAQSVVAPKVAAFTADSRVRTILTAEGADQLKSDISAYYSRLDPSINSAKAILLEETTEYYGIDMGQSIDFSGTLADPELMAVEYRAARDSYMKANNELKLATSPKEAAKAGYAAAVKNYLNYYNCADFGPGKIVEKMIDDGDL